MIICVNGEFIDSEEAKISVFDHGLLYGDGVFDTIAAVNGQIYWLDEHIDRLMEGCSLLRIKIPWTREKLIAWSRQLFDLNQVPTSRLRITITRGEGEAPIYAIRHCQPNLIIFATPLDLPQESLYHRGLSLKTVTHNRIFPRVKSLSFLPSILGFIDASECDADDAVFLKDKQYVLEGSTFNIFAVAGRTIFTPNDDILLGVTRAKVIDLARNAGCSVVEGPLMLSDMLRMDEAFITGTTKRIIPISHVDRCRIGAKTPGDVTIELLTLFRKSYF